MALAGSNGGSWSTSFSPNSGVKPSGGEAIPVSGENDTILAGKAVLSSKEIHARSYVHGNSSHGIGSNERMIMLSGKLSSFVIMLTNNGVFGCGTLNYQNQVISCNKRVIEGSVWRSFCC